MEKRKGEGEKKNYRRTWDKEYFAAKAAERGTEDGEDVEPELDHPVHRRQFDKPLVPIQARQTVFSAEAHIGTSVTVSTTAPVSQQGGFYCKDCDCAVKDSANWLDHINGKSHQKTIGHKLQTERSTLDQVKLRLQKGKRKREKEKAPTMTVAERLKLAASYTFYNIITFYFCILFFFFFLNPHPFHSFEL
eukprot:TRINITY_DN2359_c0_g1_i3.p1 TRINITY_DN2359_c0_g1~~TRINITY_DN2359_c0_g1_i3.p1  ORF type:complete len:191 (-),score=34.06 TRINITY_DN2359_c0_g1_i3:35-607(-)